MVGLSINDHDPTTEIEGMEEERIEIRRYIFHHPDLNSVPHSG